jgi:hypothetical protein
MQHRHCTCGYPVWVQYLFDEKDCKAIFWKKSGPIGTRLRLCPCCGQRLNIDELR